VRRPRGAVNLVNLTLLLLVGGATYAGWLLIPLWLDDLDVREAVSAGWGQLSYEPSDQRIRDSVLVRLRTVGSHWEEQNGKQVEIPGMGFTAQDIQVDRDPATSTGRVAIDYTRTVKLKPFERYYPVHFLAERSGIVRP
jgi:hypothetical protein